jgi:hypothetical protein
MPIEIKLTNSDRVALVDEADYPLVQNYAWWEHSPTSFSRLYYAYGMKLPRSRTGERVVKMHRLILGLSVKDPMVDHIDGNGLNNCRVNLEFITPAQNIQKANFDPDRNPRKVHSKYRGVSFLGWHGKFLAYVNYQGRREYLGYFDTAEEAARARDARAKQLHGKYARLNFADAQYPEHTDNLREPGDHL